MITDQNIKHVVLFLLVIVVLAQSRQAKGQEQDFQLWSSANIDWNFKSGWLAELQFNYNELLSGGPVWQEFALQPSVEFYPNNSIDLFAGVYLTTTKQTDDVDTDEIRPLFGLRWNIIKPEKRVFLRTQVRYEHRFFQHRTEETQENSSRIRARLDLFIPITKKSYDMNNNLYGILWSEGYFNFDNEIKERYQSTFRQYFGLGYRFSDSWRAESYYVVQAARNSITDESPDTITNAIYLTLKYYVGK